MERDLDTKLDWVAVDHFNTGHPHTHVVIRGRDDQGRELVMARDYIGHGIRARAQALITLELGPESELERVQKLFNEVGQERLTQLDRALIACAKHNILVVTSREEQGPTQHTLRVGRLKTLERLGLAEERQQGVRMLDAKIDVKLRRLGERADKFKMMHRALQEAGIERGAAVLSLFERGPRKTPLIGKVLGGGLVDEITDRTWGRAHYAELGRLAPADAPARGMLVALAGDTLHGKPSPHPKLQVLSPVAVERRTTYDGPTWLDQAIVSGWRPEAATRGFAVELGSGNGSPEAARRLFASAKPIRGTVVETYLHNRGIKVMPDVPALRFHPRAPGEAWPVLLAAVTDIRGIDHRRATHLARARRLGQGAARHAAARWPAARQCRAVWCGMTSWLPARTTDRRQNRVWHDLLVLRSIIFIGQSLMPVRPTSPPLANISLTNCVSVDGGAAYLVKFLKAFAAARAPFRMIAILDNDIAGIQAFRQASALGLPDNMTVMHLPDIELARAYPTVGPQGTHLIDVNG